MQDLLQSGLEWLSSQRNAHMAREVMYRRGVGEVTIRATKGRTFTEEQLDYGVIHRSATVDWIVLRADLATLFDGGEPLEGDEIVEVLDGLSTTYRVTTGPANSGPPAERLDGLRKEWRIHTRLVEEEQ